MNAKWLVTGAGGLLGANAVLDLQECRASVIAYARDSRPDAPVPVLAVNLASSSQRDGLVEQHSPTVVLHAAAISSIEACESDKELARRVNVDSAVDLAKQSRRNGAKFVFVSTDAVFDGHKGAYRESDDVSPTSEYGRTKVAAEQAVLAANPTALVLRVNFYGWSPSGKRSLAEFFHSRLEHREPTNGFIDVTVSTLYVRELFRAVRALVDLDAQGIVHVVSAEATTKYDFGRRLATAFDWDPSLVLSAQSRDHLAISRGSRLDLDVSRAESILGARMANQSTSMSGLVADSLSRRRELLRLFHLNR